MSNLVGVAPEIQRDRWNRPLVIPKHGGKPVPYTRCTTYIDVLEDKYNLQLWMQRMVALGLAQRPDLLLSVSAHADDKKVLNKTCEQAREAAQASAKATTGTAIHALTEMLDRGQELPPLPADTQADIDSYAAVTADLKATHIEQFCVLDTFKIGGTPDRVVKFGGKSYIADIKSGSIEWGALKIAMQLAIYARSYTYDVATGERGYHDADTTRGLIIHVPAGEANASLHWIDLEAGWAAVQVAQQVRAQRSIKFKDITEPFTGKPPTTRKQAAAAERDERKALEQIRKEITACMTADEVRSVWSKHESAWTDDLTDVARSHITALGAA